METITLTQNDLWNACFDATMNHGVEPVINYDYETTIEIENNKFHLYAEIEIKYDDENQKYHEVNFKHICCFDNDSEPVNYNLDEKETENFCLWKLNELIGENEDILY